MEEYFDEVHDCYMLTRDEMQSFLSTFADKVKEAVEGDMRTHPIAEMVVENEQLWVRIDNHLPFDKGVIRLVIDESLKP